MCTKCIDIDTKIAHLRELAVRMLDQLTLDGIAELIVKLEAQRMGLHPKEDPPAI